MIGSAILSRVPLPLWTAGAAALLMAIPLGVQTVRLSASQAEAARFYEDINDPNTGYVARLSTCRGSLADAEVAIDRQNAAVEAMAANASQAIADAQAAAAEARAERDDAQARAEQFMSRPIEGATACERVLDVDASVLADLARD